MCNPGNSGPWYIRYPGIFWTETYLKLETYSEPSQRFKIERFVKKLEGTIIFSKCSILDHWEGSEYTHVSASTH